MLRMAWMLTLWLAAIAPQTGEPALALFDKAPAWSAFLAGVTAQRDRWNANAARAAVPPALAERMARAAPGLRLLIVAQDWCLDSVNTVPYIARLAASAQIPVRIIDRTAGEPLLERYRSKDGRTVTPLVVLLRGDRVAGAWVERPAPLQQAFEEMANDPEAHRLFADRQAWYDTDAGRTTMTEIIALAERTASRRSRLPMYGEDEVLRRAAVAGADRRRGAARPAERVALDGAADTGAGLTLAAAVVRPLERNLP